MRFRKTNRPPRGTMLAAIKRAGEGGRHFTCLDVLGPWRRRQIQVLLAMMKLRRKVEVVRMAVWGRYGKPTVYRLAK